MLDDLHHSSFDRGESFTSCPDGIGLERHLGLHFLDGLLQFPVFFLEGGHSLRQRVQLFGPPLLWGVLLHVLIFFVGWVVVSSEFLLGLLVLFSEPERLCLPSILFST